MHVNIFEFQKAYIEALMAYNEGDWEDAAMKFELSLTEYYEEEERCRSYCEAGFVHTKFPDFINAIAGIDIFYVSVAW